jgi:hypothetical protein
MILNCLWDKTVIIITLLVSICLLAVFIGLIRKSSLYKGKKSLLLLIPLSVVCILPFFSAFYLPLSVKIDNDNLYVNRIIGNLTIPVHSIKDAKICTNETDGSIRYFGSGGFFGYLGIFKNDELGKYYMYAMDKSNRLIIKTVGETYVISCETPQKLIDLIRVP